MGSVRSIDSVKEGDQNKHGSFRLAEVEAEAEAAYKNLSSLPPFHCQLPHLHRPVNAHILGNVSHL